MRSTTLHSLAWMVPLGALLVGASSAVWVGTLEHQSHQAGTSASPSISTDPDAVTQASSGMDAIALPNTLPNGRPLLNTLPPAEEVWDCELVVVGGSFGGIAAAAEAMKAGTQICLIELTPWLGGQISSQGISAIDESETLLKTQNFSSSWRNFRESILNQTVQLPAWTGVSPDTRVASLNSCWVGLLCFPPAAGANAATELLNTALASSPNSRWATSTAFKGATFDTSGRIITELHAVRRVPRNAAYLPQGRLSVELNSWYGWESDETFTKVPIRLQPPAGRSMMVIDATDTGELVGWGRIPYRLGSDSWGTTGEPNASDWDNPECTQAFTLPFAMGLHDDGGGSKAALGNVQSFYSKDEHEDVFDLEGTPMFVGRSLFNYRRMVSSTYNDPFYGSPALGDITLINWTRGNDWNWMNPPLILTPENLFRTGHYQNWMGGLSALALRHGETHALMFAEWLLNTQVDPDYPLTYLYGAEGPMGTASGLSMVPYIREGRRILGRPAYGQPEFMIREQDLRNDMEGRDFSATSVAVTHYAIDIHGCRYRNWEPTGEASNASVKENLVRPIHIPIESLIPQGVDNLLIGGKSLAATHIATAAIRVHHGEWHVGATSGAIASWLIQQHPDLTPADIVPSGLMPDLQNHLNQEGLKTQW